MTDSKTSILLSDVSIEGDLVEKDKIIIDAKINGDIKADEIDTHNNSNILGNIKTFSYLLTPDYEGTMLFFPAALRHCVYPFYNTDEPRISISGNIALMSA